MRVFPQSRKTCAQCGFLGIRLDGDELAEFPPDGRSPDHQRFVNRTIVSRMRCSRHASDLRQEIKDADSRVASGKTERPQDIPDAALREVIHKARACAFFFHYVQGANPKQHLERQDKAQTENRRRAWTLGVALVAAIFGAIATVALLYFVG